MKTLATISAVARREVWEILADRWTSVALFIVPLIAAVLMTLIYAGQSVTDLPVLVVDRDQSVLSRALIRSLDASESIAVREISTSAVDADERVSSGRFECVIEIPDGFERDIKRGGQVQVLCGVNGSNLVPAITALKGANTVIMTFAAGVSMVKMEKKGVPSSQAVTAYVPVAVTSRNSFNATESYGRFLLPGVLAALLQMIITVGAALTWVREIESGRYHELQRLTESLTLQTGGKVLVYVTIGGAWSAVFFAGLLPLADAPISGSLFAAIASIVLMMIGMTLVAMMISALVPTRSTAMQFVFIASSPAFIVSGYTFPLLSMTWPVQLLANLIPLTPFLVAWRRIVLYGAGFADVWSQVFQMFALALVFGAIMTIVMRKRTVQSVGRGPQ